MTGMMRKHFETIAVNMGQMAWVTTFFAGMVLGLCVWKGVFF